MFIDREIRENDEPFRQILKRLQDWPLGNSTITGECLIVTLGACHSVLRCLLCVDMVRIPAKEVANQSLT